MVIPLKGVAIIFFGLLMVFIFIERRKKSLFFLIFFVLKKTGEGKNKANGNNKFFAYNF